MDLLKSRTLSATLDLRDWVARARLAGVPCIPAEECPVELDLREEPGGLRLQELSAWTERRVRELAGDRGGAVWRWNLCAPLELKAAMSHPGLPVRVPWPAAATEDERLRAVLTEARAAGLLTLTTLVRPWVAAKCEGGFPVEVRVFVTCSGGVSVTSYYTQHPLGPEWLPYAERAAAMALRLRPYVPAVAEYSADFLVAETGEVLMLEGGPPCCYGADPCLLGPDGPFGDGRIVLG
jgi:hypothetical protein